MTLIYPVLMVGGAGTRLWPTSKNSMPKQFQPLITDRSLFEDTVLRVTGSHNDIQFTPPIIIGAKRYEGIIDSQLKNIGTQATAIILEPLQRSTTPVAAICSQILKKADNGIALLLPSDHHIPDTNSFRTAIAQASKTAQDGWITALGIKPTYPATGYGYIKAGRALTEKTCHIDSFREKPNLAQAHVYLDDEDYFWNSGIFLFQADRMLEELNKYASVTTSNAIDAFLHAEIKGRKIYLEDSRFSKCESISLDYSVMEKTKHAAVYTDLQCGWNDVGDWKAISDLNTCTEHANIVSIDNTNCYIHTDGSKIITALGLSDLIIVAEKDNVLIIPKARTQDVQEIIKELRKRGLQSALE